MRPASIERSTQVIALLIVVEKEKKQTAAVPFFETSGGCSRETNLGGPSAGTRPWRGNEMTASRVRAIGWFLIFLPVGGYCSPYLVLDAAAAAAAVASAV